MAQFYIPESRFVSFNSKAKALLKKCKKAGVDCTYSVGQLTTLTVTVHNHYLRKNDERYKTKINVYPVELEAKLKYNGWTVIGTVMIKDGIRQAYFGKHVDLAKKYFDVDMHRCDHCKTRRSRKSVCVLEHEDGRQMVIGTTCVKEFTEGLDGSLCSEILSFYDEKYHMHVNIDDRCGECDWDAFTNYFGGSVGSVASAENCRHYMTEEVVAYTAALIDKYGYVSKKQSQELMGEVAPTAMLLDSFIKDCRKGSECVEDKHTALAKESISWCAGLTDDEVTSNYMLNMRELCRDSFCTKAHWGMLTSLVPAYRRELEKRIQKPNTVKSEYISEVGKRSAFDVTLLADIPFDDYNRFSGCLVTKHVYKMDCGGNVLVWITEGLIGRNPGETFRMTGTVKKHSEYKGTKQTVLTRCKIAQQKSA